MDPEQGYDHSDGDIDPGELQKLVSLMDDEGNLPAHDERAEEAPAADKQQPAPQAKPRQPLPQHIPTQQRDRDERTDDQNSEQQREEQSQQASVEEIEYDGRKYTVPAELKGAFLRQADYTQKTQQVANERAAVHQERQFAQHMAVEAQQFVGHYAAVSQIDNQLQQLQRVDLASLQAQDPVKAIELRQTWNDLVNARGAVLAQLDGARRQMAQREAVTLQQTTQEGMQTLARDIEGWGAEKQTALRTTAVSDYGFRPEELAGLTDPRMVKVLHDAHQWRQLQQQKPNVQRQIQQAPQRTVRPSNAARRGADDDNRYGEAMGRLRKTGSDDDAVRALRALDLG